MNDKDHLKILFIINPKAGVKRKLNIETMIKEVFLSSPTFFEIKYTESAGHATELAREAAKKGFDIVVACGGDGTMNEVARGLLGTRTSVYILPLGSGNGLARHLGIPMDINKALMNISASTLQQIDVIKINNQYSFNVSGIGFDAHVANAFAKLPGRGFLNYAKAIIREFVSYPEQVFNIEIEGAQIHKSAWMMSICNSNQFGNNFFIAPKAELADGLMDIAFLRKLNVWSALSVAMKLFRKNIYTSPYYECIQCSTLIIRNSGSMYMHIDGDPVQLEGDILIAVDGKLNVRA